MACHMKNVQKTGVTLRLCRIESGMLSSPDNTFLLGMVFQIGKITFFGLTTKTTRSIWNVVDV